ncbi:MAG: hypothetical protein R2795_16855 [Saprospiraceae bacterium]
MGFVLKRPWEEWGTRRDCQRLLFLASDEAAYITATTLSVDGGVRI